MAMIVLITLGTAVSMVHVLPDKQKTALFKRLEPVRLAVIDLAVAHGLTSCAIKGNISARSGRKIYHVPGQKYYLRTRIRPFHGERWFCTENEAIAAGWRRARR